MDDELLAGRYRRLVPIGDTATPWRVWLARDEVLDRHVALKQIALPGWVSDAERSRLRDATLREVRALASLDHPGVAGMWDVVSADGCLWLVMEHVPSRSLAEVVAAGGPLAPAEVTRVGLHLLAALGAAHASGVLHREICPRNVLLADDGRVILGGFGLSILDSRAPAAVTAATLSKLQYVAPERTRDGRSTPAADLWALGVTLYLAAEGRLPWTRPTALATLAALATEAPDRMTVPPLEPSILGLLQRNPRQRLSTQEACDRLEQVLASTSPVHPVPARPSARPRRWRRAAAATDPVPQDTIDTTALAVTTSTTRDRTTGWAFAGAVLGLLGVGTVVVTAAGAVVGAVRAQDGTPAGGLDGPAADAVVTTAPARPGHLCLNDAAGEAEPLREPTEPPPHAPPSGWAWHQDPAGFLIAVPERWTRHTEGTTICLRDPARTDAIAVDPTVRASAVPSKRWDVAERDLLETGALTGYQRISIGPIIRPGGAAEWEYTCDQPNGERLHVRRLLINDGRSRAYSLSWITQDSRWIRTRSVQQTALATFRLA
ncbi:Serine/threonine protein kinase [Micromonospora sediminicola]|uniref:non-specific serine/threonine protein kinase n=1 Tax=Micromonospora sediminicola TaxID=946078 RepID=A0A1A9B9Q8_9ACTN|nr:serine/threonine-protein kinase [Micromonospora sediminicola]SBT65806.1 Serine/threonine protein kinase [Micromonospora sediminicola]